MSRRTEARRPAALPFPPFWASMTPSGEVPSASAAPRAFPADTGAGAAQVDPRAAEGAPEIAAVGTSDDMRFPFWRRNMLALLFANFVLTSGFASASPYLPLILREQGFAGNLETWVGLTVGGFFIVSFFFTPIWGSVADHFGRKSMVLRAGLGMGAIYLLLPWAPHPGLFIGLYLVMGMFNGFVPSSLALAATNTPVRHMGKALSWIQAGALLGNTFGPAVGGLIAVMLPRYRDLFLVSGGCILAAGLVALVFARERKETPKGRFEPHLLRDLATLARISRMPMLYALNFLVSVSFWGSIPVVSVYTLELLHGTPGAQGKDEAFWMGAVAMAIAIASALALPLWGRVLDRLEVKRVLAIALAAGALGGIPTVLAQNPLQLVFARLTFGLLAAGAMPAMVTVLRSLAPAGMEARAMAIGTAFGMLGMGSGPLLGGFIGPVFGLRAYFAVNVLVLALAFAAWSRWGLRESAAQPAVSGA